MVNVPVKKSTYPPGGKIAGYEVISPIGSGSFGDLYLVRDVTGGCFALKVLQNGSARELAALQKFRQIPPAPGLTAIHAAGTLPDGKIYYLMDAADNLLENGHYLPDTLANRLARTGCLTAQDTLQLAAALLPAVAHLHAHGVAHFDVKPENVIFIHNSPLLADFGSLDNCDSAGNGPAVTEGFYPPEELNGSVNGHFSPKNDLYALGMTLYCAWSGHAPEDYPRLPDGITPADVKGIRKLLQKACHENPAYRFQDAPEFLRAVERLRERLREPAKRKRRQWYCLLLLFCFLTAAALLIFLRHAGETRRAFQQELQRVEKTVRLAQMAEDAHILNDLQEIAKLLDHNELQKLDVPSQIAAFQSLHLLLQEYTREKTAGETGKRERLKKLTGMAGRCPQSCHDPRLRLNACIEKKRDLTGEEKNLLNRLESVCGGAYRQLQLELAAARKIKNGAPAEAEKRLREFKAAFPVETAYIDLCRELRGAPDAKAILRVRRELETLKIRLRK